MYSAERTDRTLAARFQPGSNSLNALRLGLASAVIISHVWPLGGYGLDPGSGPDTSNLGTWAVAGFFGISGFLITGSRLHSRSVLDFVWRRALRIYPAFLVAVVIVGLIVAPIGAQLNKANTWTLTTGTQFIVQALPLRMQEYAPAGSLVSVPHPSGYLLTLWTLPLEFLCYLTIGVLASLTRKTSALTVCCVAWLALSTISTILHEVLNTSDYSLLTRISRLGAFFAAGALLFLLKDKVKVSGRLALASLFAIVGLILIGRFTAFAGVPMAYLMLYLGVTLPLQNVGARNDISYGMYIWGAPVQQIIVLIAGARTLPLWLFLLLSVILTVPLGWASWLLVERPAMRWKNLTFAVRRKG